MKRAVIIFTACAALALQGCASVEDLQDENAQLHALSDSLKSSDEECHARYITVVQRMASLETENMKLDDRNRQLSAKLAEMNNLPTATVVQNTNAGQQTAPAGKESAVTKARDAGKSGKGAKEGTTPKVVKRAETQPPPKGGGAEVGEAGSVAQTEAGGKNGGGLRRVPQPKGGGDVGVPVADKSGPEATFERKSAESKTAGKRTVDRKTASGVQHTGAPLPASAIAGYTQAAATRADEAFLSRYQAALSKFHAGSYSESMDMFSALYNSPAQNQMTDNCMYWIGECLSAMGDFEGAIPWYSAVLQFPESEKQDDALIMRGNACAKLGDVESARRDYKRLVQEYPHSEYMPLAKKKLEKMK